MARDYGRIRAQFWNDEKVKSWPLDLKAVASYLLTCEHTTALGAFRLPAAYMSDDLDITPSQARSYLADLQAHGFIKVCPSSGWIWIINYLRHNRPENANVLKHIRGLARAIPATVTFRDQLLDALEQPDRNAPETQKLSEIHLWEPSAKGSETLSNNRAEPILTEPIPTDTNREVEGAETATPPPASPRGSRLPEDWSPSEADSTFAAEQGFGPSAIVRITGKFRDYWIAKAGAGGVKLDWSATWRNWVRREAEDGRNLGGRQHGEAPVSTGEAQRNRQLAAALASIR